MLLKQDLNTHIYGELQTAIHRGDETIMETAIASALAQAKAYLHRYDLDALFGATGNDRDPLLLMYLKDMAAWHFITLANANVDLELRKTRFDEALKALKEIQEGKTMPADWPVPTVPAGEQDPNSLFLLKSRPKRTTNY